MAWPTTSRQSRGYGSDHDRMRAMLMREVMLCEDCTRRGVMTVGTIADHIVPKAKGGSNERSNYQLLCKRCSDAKGLEDKGQTGKAVRSGVDAAGRPTDPAHPWNRVNLG